MDEIKWEGDSGIKIDNPNKSHVAHKRGKKNA
jgi:hypothetical protein